MAKETVYNNTLVSGAADETLTYTRYVKDESSGKSTKELLDEKVNKTDQLGTTQIADKAVTTEKLENESVTTDKLDAASVTTEKVADANITTSKLADSSVETEKINNKAVTTDKLNDGAVDNSKLSPNAVTSEKIKDESIITEKLNDRAVTTEKVEEKAITNAKLGDQSVDGRVVREASLESKHFSNESVTTEKIARKSITKDKLADNAVDASQVVDGSIGNAKLSPDSVTTEKIKDGSVTNEKIADNTLGIGKFDPELRKTIQAATGLPEDLNQMIQDIDQSVKQLHEKDTDLQSQIDDKQQQITANDEDISLLQTRSTQMEETIKSIAATGGASQATAVTYNNEKSKLTAVNIQSAVDEVVDKTAIKDEEGNVLDTPFRIIENEEFIMAVVDSEDRYLFGIYRATGKPYYPLNDMYHISQSEEFLWVILDAANHPLLGIQQDGTSWAAKAQWLDDIKAIKKALSSIDETLKAFQPKEDGKGLINIEVADSFFYISNDEYIIAVVDAEGRILAGIKYDGEPYFPNHEMYSVITNEEWLYAIIDVEDKVLGGFRADDGHMLVGGIDISTFIANAIIDIADIKERTTHLSTIENDEYLSVETDAKGKVIGYIAPDGSHYLYKVKSETIPTEFSHIEDPEGRTEITTDADDKILGYRDSEGTRHEHKISVSHINLSDEAAKEVNESFKSAGIKMDNPSDFSKDSHIELPIPRIAAQVRLYAPKLPTTKQDDIEAEIEYNDKDGNYFRKPVILNAQGSSSMGYYVKNMAIDINDGSEIKFGDFPTQDSFHLKKYYIDAFRGQCIVGYWLMEQVYKSRPIGQQYPYEYTIANESVSEGLGSPKKDFFTGAKCHPDGFPINITWISNDGTETDMGIYAWNLKKSKEVYYADKKKAENIILDGRIGRDTIFGGTIDWTAFEIRNPKSLIDINGNKYDGDNPKELSNSDANSKKVKDYLIRLSGVSSELKSSNTKETFEQYFLPKPFIDYFLLLQMVFHYDGSYKNWIWVTYNGLQWTPTAYDMDSIFGQSWNGTHEVPSSDKTYLDCDWSCMGLPQLYAEEIKARYKELRDLKIFDADNIVSLLNKWLGMIGYNNLAKEYELYTETPSYRDGGVSENWEMVYDFLSGDAYSAEKQYSVGDRCSYGGMIFKAKVQTQGVPPLTKTYSKNPTHGGFFNSPKRVYNWFVSHIDFLDGKYEYSK